ncbi:MAG: hypothetical protein COS85_17130, partial [Armatimonadetes bacterium CG07_land_8_20_14_0_80_59_28]
MNVLWRFTLQWITSPAPSAVSRLRRCGSTPAVWRREWFETFLELSNGIPSHDTFGRIFALLSPTGLEAGFVKWVQSVAQLL